MHGDGAIYRTLVDVCWPERYNAAARDETLDPFRKQVNNGNVMNQTVWNYMFEAGTDKLTAAGYDKLDSLTKVRPYPDGKLYLQTSRDIGVTPENVDKLAAMREDLDGKRAAAVQRYMASQPAINPTVYEVYIHDPVVPGIDSEFAARAYRGSALGYRGGIGGGSGAVATATGGGGPTPPASSIGTGTGAGGALGGSTTPGGSATGPR
jgi:hypothetical protein